MSFTLSKCAKFNSILFYSRLVFYLKGDMNRAKYCLNPNISIIRWKYVQTTNDFDITFVWTIQSSQGDYGTVFNLVFHYSKCYSFCSFKKVYVSLFYFGGDVQHQ